MKKIFLLAGVMMTLALGTASANDYNDVAGVSVSLSERLRVEAKINAMLAKDVARAQHAGAQLLAKEAPATGPVLDHWQMYSQQVTYQSDRYLSVVAKGTSFDGGAHPDTQWRAWVFDKQNGQTVTLADFLGERSNAATNRLVRAYVQRALTARAIEYWPEELAKATAVYNDLPYYLNDHGDAVVIFNPAQIAPYATGVLEVVVPARLQHN